MNSTRAGRRHFTEEERASLLTAYHQSGLTQSDFAARHGLSLSCLGIWLRKSRKSGTNLVTYRLVELPVSLAMGSRHRPIYKIGFPNGQSLEASSGFDIEEVRELCQLLREL